MRYSKCEELFWDLYQCKTEQEVDLLIQRRPEVFAPSNWYPLGGEYGNFATVENQAADPVPAIVEKLTNSIDAILMRRCYEAGIDPKSEVAPQSVEDAIHRFFPQHRDWDLVGVRSEQARSIQVLADGYAKDTSNASIIIYDDGEGQHPEKFAETFLSIGRGNKNEIKFVQGVFNMGGCGAITFCGEKRYQLVASKRFDAKGKFGFALIRKHPLSTEEETRYKKTWYEYLTIDNHIPAFEIDELDLGLHQRMFRTGSIIKLYSYDLEGNRYLNRDLSRSINEYLYSPVLPILIHDSKERYPGAGDKFHPQVLFGLKRRLERSEYVETGFSEELMDREIGKVKINVYVFKVRAKDRSLKDTKSTFRGQYFKNNMCVLFSLNGQVHGHYSSEFVSRTLKFNLLKDYLLIHVDCTEMRAKFRDELTMPSRDRFKNSKQMKSLRKKLGEKLSSGRLRDIYKSRKDRLAYDSSDSEALLKQVAEDLPLQKEMRELIKQTLELDKPGDRQKPKPRKPPEPSEPVVLQRYPSFMRVKAKERNGRPTLSIPIGGARTMRFESDVVDDYFDRSEDPGGLEFAVMTYTPNEATGGDKKGTVNNISEILSVNKKSPHNGTIRVVFEPTKDLLVGDEIEVQSDFTHTANPNSVPPAIFWIAIVEPNKPPKPKPPPREEKLGLPQPIMVYEYSESGSGFRTWRDLEDETIEMNHAVVMHPLVEGDKLEAIFINMDSGVLKNFKSKKRNPSLEQDELANRQYISRVYYHTLFLYLISKNRKYAISKMNGDENYDDVDLTDYLRDLFDNNYADFLLNFDTSALMEGLG